jgi:extracellular elastinolytic metalloproteinase
MPSSQASREPRVVALEYVRAHASELGVTPADVEDVAVTSESKSKQSGASHVYLQQRYRGIPVWGADLTVNIARDGRVVGAEGHFVSRLAAAAAAAPAGPTLTAAEAFAAAATHLDLQLTAPVRVMRPAHGATQETLLSDGGIAAKPVPVELVFYPTPAAAVRLAWIVEIEERSAQHWWVALVDAGTGALLHKFDRVTQGNEP